MPIAPNGATRNVGLSPPRIPKPVKRAAQSQ